jgi:hypothetical protein
MNKRFHQVAISCVGALAGLALLTLASVASTPVQATTADPLVGSLLASEIEKPLHAIRLCS